MEQTEFIFRCRPLTGSALLPQVSWALERRTELMSRDEHPNMWHQIDRLRTVASGLPRTSRSRKVGSVLCLLLGIVLLVPGLMDPGGSLLLLIAGIVGVVVGIGGFCVKRNPKKSAFDLAAENLLASRALIGDDQIRVLFREEAMTIEQDHVGEEIPYSKIELAVETRDTWLLLFDERAMVLLKDDLAGDQEAFHAFLARKVRCE